MDGEGKTAAGITYSHALRQGKQFLANAGVPEPDCSAWYLFSYCFHMEKSRFFLCQDELAEEEALQEYGKMISMRAERIPLEYIIHETEFMGLLFYVDEHVLIPRQDTECLVEEVLKFSSGKRILDLCTGSGCIGISLAVLGNCKSVTMSDISLQALAAAKKNAHANNVEGIFVQSDLFREIKGEYDIIVSNPPYICTGEIAGLMPEVRDHEPMLALDGKEDGLAFYRCIIQDSRQFLAADGKLCFEIGCDQGSSVKELMEQAGFCEVEIKQDLAGLDRIVIGCFSKEIEK